MTIDWSNHVANPSALGDAEKKLWTELEPLIGALLEELKKNGHIETVHANTEYEDLSSMLDNLEQSSKTYIAMMRINDKDKLESFLGAVKGFGIDEQIMVRIWLGGPLCGCFQHRVVKDAYSLSSQGR